MRPARLAETLAAINWLQTVGSLERQRPPWILRGKSADLIQLPKLVLGECEFDRREIVLKVVEAFRAWYRSIWSVCKRRRLASTASIMWPRDAPMSFGPGPTRL